MRKLIFGTFGVVGKTVVFLLIVIQTYATVAGPSTTRSRCHDLLDALGGARWCTVFDRDR